MIALTVIESLVTKPNYKKQVMTCIIQQKMLHTTLDMSHHPITPTRL